MVFFVNGILDNKDEANDNLTKLQRRTQSSLGEIKNLKYSLARVEDSWAPLQLAQTFLQRANDDFQRYWLWLDGLEQPPSWFDEAVKNIFASPQTLNAVALPELQDHLELYSDAILDGYLVIVVSHSAGNFYANAALRTLPGYTPAALQPPLNDRHRDIPDYPAPQDLIANIQIASPVKETINNSPWITFNDDQVIRWVRTSIGALPGNVSSHGSSPDDPRGHGLASYLRVDESRNLLIQDLKAAYARLKYPIPYFQDAATVETLDSANDTTGNSLFTYFFEGPKELTTYDEKPLPNGDKIGHTRVQCIDLRLGEVDIRAETDRVDSRKNDFGATGYVGSGGDGKALRMRNSSSLNRWRLGRIRVEHGQGRDPIEVGVNYLDHPELLR